MSRAMFCFDNSYVRLPARCHVRLDPVPAASPRLLAFNHAFGIPAIIPRNHHAEAALHAAVEADDLKPFQRLCTVLQRPYEVAADESPYAAPPDAPDRGYRTFCGT